MSNLHLVGDPVQIDFFNLHFLKLREILHPQTNYDFHLALFFLNKEDLGFKKEIFNAYSLFELIKGRAYLDEEFKQHVLKTLKLFTKEDFEFDDENFILKGNILLEEHWTQIKNFLIEENQIDLDKEEKEDLNQITDPRILKMKQQMQENRRLVAKYKKEKRPTLDFLVSAFSAASLNTNLLQTLELTIYQFRNQLDRLIKTENYDLTMKSLLAGADPKKTKIVHWTENN